MLVSSSNLEMHRSLFLGRGCLLFWGFLSFFSFCFAFNVHG